MYLSPMQADKIEKESDRGEKKNSKMYLVIYVLSTSLSGRIILVITEALNDEGLF